LDELFSVRNKFFVADYFQFDPVGEADFAGEAAVRMASSAE